MSKGMTPLEALNNIKLKLMRSYDNSYGCNGNVMFEKELPIIEKALKEYERLKETLITATRSPVEINKEHKALEIIKENIFLDENNDLMPKNKTKSQSDIDLLKEVFK